MFNIFEQFIVLSIEITIYIFIWSKFFDKNHEYSLFRNIVAMFLTAFIASVSLVYFENNYTTFINYIIIILVFTIVHQTSLLKTSIEFFIISFVNIVLQGALILTANLVNLKLKSMFIFCAGGLLLELVFIVIVYYFFLERRNLKVFNGDSKTLCYLLVNLSLYVFVFRFILQYNQDLVFKNLHVFIFIAIGLLGVNILLYYYIMRITEEKKVLEIQNKYNPILLNIIEETRRRQHDFKNYLNTINGMIEVAEEREIKPELKKYIRSLGGLNKNIEDITYIDNIIIKSIIYNKLCEAERSNIKFSFNVRNNILEQCLNDYEMSDILNNLLNNAFEAVVAEKHKEVILNIFSQEDKNIVEVKNIGINIEPENIYKIFKRGFSTKNKESRGYGLYNIKKIVEQHGGKVQLSFEDNYTIFRILFFSKTLRRFRFSK